MDPLYSSDDVKHNSAMVAMQVMDLDEATLNRLQMVTYAAGKALEALTAAGCDRRLAAGMVIGATLEAVIPA